MNNSKTKYRLDEQTILLFSLCLTIAGLIAIGYFIISFFQGNAPFINKEINSTAMSEFGGFIGGFIGTIFSLVTVFLVWLAYQSQQKEMGEITKQGKEQIEIQSISVLIPIYKQKINELNDLANSVASLASGGGSDEYFKNTILPARKNIKKYENLLDKAENQLLTKSKTLFDWSKKIDNDNLKDEAVPPTN